MGIFGKLFSFERTDPEVDVTRSIIDDLTKNGTLNLFNKPIFRWDQKKSDRLIEAAILSRFFLDYALIKLSESRPIKNDAVEAVRKIIMLGFIAYIKQHGSKEFFDRQDKNDYIRSRMLRYLNVMSNHEPPVCWLKIAETLTNKSYINDPEVLIVASLQLPSIQAAALHNVGIILDGAIAAYE